jgi:2-keto-4-pentenoate hydratase
VAANPPADGDRTAAIEAAADRLIDAALRATPCRALREILPDGDLEDGYAVQQLVRARTSSGRRRVGRKVGLTSDAVREQMGVVAPDFGVLYADMAYGDAEPIPYSRLLQPRIEAEVAFVLGEDLPARAVTTTEVLGAVDFVVVAIEVCDSRIENWDISIFDTVADNASSGVFVTGAAPRSMRDIDDLRTAQMTLVTAGATVSSGRGSACMGHPVNAVVWLANTVAERGEPLQAGEVGLGSVRAVFTDR